MRCNQIKKCISITCRDEYHWVQLSTGLGLGMGVGLGGSVGNAFGSITEEINTGATNTYRECPNCHAAMKKEQRFCGTCGFDTEGIGKNHKKNANSDVQCSNCGAKLIKNMKFCPECGNKYNPCPQCGNSMGDYIKCWHVGFYHSVMHLYGKRH